MQEEPSSVKSEEPLHFLLNGTQVALAPQDLESSLLTTLRERFGVKSVKDGCAPQGQCGCCTVWIDGAPRVACVTATARVIGRSVTTVEGLDPAVAHVLADAFASCGAAQCGFCTPGMVMRLAPLLGTTPTPTSLGNAVSAQMCRCTGWQPILEAFDAANQGIPTGNDADPSDTSAAERQSALEWGASQPHSTASAMGELCFADDDAPSDAVVAVLAAPGIPGAITAAGMQWVIGSTREEARVRAGHLQGRKTTIEPIPPFAAVTGGDVQLSTCWVDSGYLEPDASWCIPGGEPASPRRFGGAFGGKAGSPVMDAARELAAALEVPVRVSWSREDVIRQSVKRPPMSVAASFDGEHIVLTGVVAAPCAKAITERFESLTLPYTIPVEVQLREEPVKGPPVAMAPRASGVAELWSVVEAVLTDAQLSRGAHLVDERARSVVLDTVAPSASGAVAGARVMLNESGSLSEVFVRVAAGVPEDPVVLRSYCIGAVHAALGVALSEAIAVDSETGEVLTLTIRGGGQLRAKDMPQVHIEIVNEDGPALAAGDAVFSAVLAATWNAVTAFEGSRPTVFPMRGTTTARPLRR